MSMTKYKTAERVRRGHPDKLCDLIADSILDECLRHDRYSRCACEVMATKGKIFVCGEITCAAKINIRSVVREVLRKAGYNPMKFIVFVYVHRQSSDIAGGVDSALEVRDGGSEDVFATTGAGDQGTVYGYATRETWTRLPVPVVFANDICKDLDEAMRDGTIRGIGPDGKAQVTVVYEDGKPVGVKNIVVSVQHDEGKNLEELRREIISEVLYPILDRFSFPKDMEILINPSGRFVEGGPAADTGLTGRKLMVDTYGGLAAHGGGAFSGKDPTKVDRSAAYMARAIARNVVARGWRKNARFPFPTRSAKRNPPLWRLTPLAPPRWTRMSSGWRYWTCSTCGPPPSCPCCISALLSTPTPPPTATSMDTSTAGKTSTRPMNCGRR